MTDRRPDGTDDGLPLRAANYLRVPYGSWSPVSHDSDGRSQDDVHSEQNCSSSLASVRHSSSSPEEAEPRAPPASVDSGVSVPEKSDSREFGASVHGGPHAPGLSDSRASDACDHGGPRVPEMSDSWASNACVHGDSSAPELSEQDTTSSHELRVPPTSPRSPPAPSPSLTSLVGLTTLSTLMHERKLGMSTKHSRGRVLDFLTEKDWKLPKPLSCVDTKPVHIHYSSAAQKNKRNAAPPPAAPRLPPQCPRCLRRKSALLGIARYHASSSQPFQAASRSHSSEGRKANPPDGHDQSAKGLQLADQQGRAWSELGCSCERDQTSCRPASTGRASGGRGGADRVDRKEADAAGRTQNNSELSACKEGEPRQPASASPVLVHPDQRCTPSSFRLLPLAVHGQIICRRSCGDNDLSSRVLSGIARSDLKTDPQDPKATQPRPSRMTAAASSTEHSSPAVFSRRSRGQMHNAFEPFWEEGRRPATYKRLVIEDTSASPKQTEGDASKQTDGRTFQRGGRSSRSTASLVQSYKSVLMGYQVTAQNCAEKCLPGRRADKCLPGRRAETCLPGKRAQKCLPDKREDKCLPDKREDKCLPNRRAQKCLSDKREDKCLPDKRAEKCLSDKREDKCLPDKRAQKCLSDKREDKCLSDKRADKCLSGTRAEKCLPGKNLLPSVSLDNENRSNSGLFSNIYQRRKEFENDDEAFYSAIKLIQQHNQLPFAGTDKGETKENEEISSRAQQKAFDPVSGMSIGARPKQRLPIISISNMSTHKAEPQQFSDRYQWAWGYVNQRWPYANHLQSSFDANFARPSNAAVGASQSKTSAENPLYSGETGKQAEKMCLADVCQIPQLSGLSIGWQRPETPTCSQQKASHGEDRNSPKGAGLSGKTLVAGCAPSLLETLTLSAGGSGWGARRNWYQRRAALNPDRVVVKSLQQADCGVGQPFPPSDELPIGQSRSRTVLSDTEVVRARCPTYPEAEVKAQLPCRPSRSDPVQNINVRHLPSFAESARQARFVTKDKEKRRERKIAKIPPCASSVNEPADIGTLLQIRPVPTAVKKPKERKRRQRRKPRRTPAVAVQIRTSVTFDSQSPTTEYEQRACSLARDGVGDKDIRSEDCNGESLASLLPQSFGRDDVVSEGKSAANAREAHERERSVKERESDDSGDDADSNNTLDDNDDEKDLQEAEGNDDDDAINYKPLCSRMMKQYWQQIKEHSEVGRMLVRAFARRNKDMYDKFSRVSHSPSAKASNS